MGQVVEAVEWVDRPKGMGQVVEAVEWVDRPKIGELTVKVIDPLLRDAANHTMPSCAVSPRLTGSFQGMVEVKCKEGMYLQRSVNNETSVLHNSVDGVCVPCEPGYFGPSDFLCFYSCVLIANDL